MLTTPNTAVSSDTRPLKTHPSQIVKRDGRVVPFDNNRIQQALDKCFASLGRKPMTNTAVLTTAIISAITAKYDLPTVEAVQDVAETVLQAHGEYEAAKAYILYRAERAKLRQARPIPAEVTAAFAESDTYFPTQLQKFQFYDKYSRFNYELGRRETWVETVDRAVAFLRELSEDKLPATDYERIKRGILEMKVMPSMRLLAMAGQAARRNNIAIYNCAYLPVDSIDSFVEALIISMSGCGVGFSVERVYVEQLPRIQRQRGQDAVPHVVADTSEGWAEAVRMGLEAWFDGRDVAFDYSEVRPAGAPLHTKGGRASGPEPLRKMLNFARERILARQGSFMTTLDAHDIMCAVGNAAVSGGVRRTAMISLFDYDDHDMRHCKDGDFWVNNSQRWNANNSAVWPERALTQQEVTRFVLDMVESGRGEPGIFNRRAAVTSKPERRKEARFGTNPCVTGDTWVMTSEGPVQVNDLRGRAFTALVDGKQYPSTKEGFFPTGHKPIYALETEEGHILHATADHPILKVTSGNDKEQHTEWTDVIDLKAGDLIRLHNQRGAVWGSNDSLELAWMWGLSDDTNITTHIEQTSSSFHSAFLRGFFVGGLGIVEDEDYGASIHLAKKSIKALKAAQRMLGRLGILSAIHEKKDRDVNQQEIDGSYFHRDNWEKYYPELVIRNDNVRIFKERIGFADASEAIKISEWLLKHEQPCEQFVARVKSITAVGTADVYDCTIPGVHAFDANGLYVHNCGEIILREYGFCNLTSAVARVDDTAKTLLEKVELATIIGTIQSMATHFPGLRPQWSQNAREERLLGVDLNGQLDSPIAQDAAVQAQLRAHAVETNRIYAKKLGIPQSAAVTTVKPSGNSSQLLNSSSGLHARWSPYYVRNVRVGAHTPLFKVLQDAGVPMHPENGQEAKTANTWVIHFPTASPEGSVTRNDRTAVEQCDYWLQNKRAYTEHNPSVTITYKHDEVLDIIRWIDEHQDIIGGMAFLPAFDAQYDQMPYEEIGRAEYERLAAEFPDIDFSKVYRYEEVDLTTAAQELACLAGGCDDSVPSAPL